MAQRRIYVNKSKAGEVIAKITQQQSRRNLFVNVAVQPYKGKRYNSATTVVIVVG